MTNQIKNILNKGIKDSANENDRQEMLALFHKPGNEFELKEELFEKISEELTSNIRQPDYNNLFSKLWAKIEKTKKQDRLRILYLNLKIAAAVIIGLFIGIYVSSIKSVPTEPLYYSAHSPRGSVSDMLLPDGSVIFLNADSRIKYSIDGENQTREVFLTGEAWFDVAKNEKKPFVVHTPYYNVKVTGTQFNIKAYDSDKEVTTTLEKGQVVIHSTENFKLAEEVVLIPGEQIILNKETRKTSIKTVNTKWFTSWKDNKLIFVNMELKDLEVLLERKYGVDIEIKNKKILDLHFDGTIKNESIIEILDVIKKTLPVNYKIVGQHIVITDNKN